MNTKSIAMILGLAAASAAAQAAPTFMSPEWAAQACKAWNQDGELTKGLGDDWIENDAGRGYKVIQIYRSDCPDSKKIELTIKKDGDKAVCSYGGAVAHNELNSDVDYLMYASDEDWDCMGKGEWGCGPMGAMATGKLKFEGPKVEAMSVMGPFEGFLLLTGKVEADRKACP
ncbi:MAG TPA: sterol-binding protein [Sedimenticola thiotaurini]|uniref:Sterol-binding protein n=1 Tax=Sedimenticola thiotaurini TaxID=1543721 RepID=A0A831RJ94_9GAMM|nr:sterol-binding protein [Sedimenticola thiotaurini]